MVAWGISWLVTAGVFWQGTYPNNINTQKCILNLELNKTLTQKKSDFILPQLTTETYLVYSLNDNKIILKNEMATKKSIASLTKLMTAALVLDKEDLTEVVSVNPQATGTIWSKMWLRSREKITRENLLKGLLIQSANDAAFALAYDYSGDFDLFVDEMNEGAKNLQMLNSHFTNPAGFDRGENYSTIEDLLKLVKFLWQFEEFKNIVATRYEEVASADEKFSHKLYSTNKLFDSYLAPITFGIKTGTTPEAGECLINFFSKDNIDLITIILGSTDRYSDVKNLLNWVEKNYYF